MRVVRGRPDTRKADRELTRAVADAVAADGEPTVRVWAPARQLSFGRRDANRPGYEAAARAARRRGFPPTVREVGGRAVAHTGSTLAFSRVTPVSDVRGGIGERYEAALGAVQRALWSVGVPAQRGEPPEAFCPGSHSLQYRGKLVGLAQRVTARAAVTSGVLVLDGREEVGDVLAAVYDALDVPFDPATVGSVAHAGGDVSRVRDAVEDALAGDEADVEVVPAEALRKR